MYQPNMLGVEQGGVAETMQFILSCYPAQIQQELVNVSFKNKIWWTCFTIVDCVYRMCLLPVATRSFHNLETDWEWSWEQ